MSIAAISPTAVAQATPAKVVAANQQSDRADSFAKTIAKVIGDVNLNQQQADAALEGLATGKIDNVHDVVLAVAKADLSFRFLLEVRNRLTEAYQEISSMRF